MRFTTTLILLLVAAGVYWWIRTVDEDVEAPPAPRPPLVDEEIFAGLEEVELTLFSKEILKVVKEPGGRLHMQFGRDRLGNRWLYKDRVDENLARQLLMAIHDSYRGQLLGAETEDDLLRLNLDPPKYTMLVRGAGREAEVHFGADDPATGGMIMARDVKAGTLFRVGRQVPNILDFNRDDFRERRVFLLDTRAVDEVQVQYTGSLEPGKVETNPNAVESLLRAVRGASDRWTVFDDMNGVTAKGDPNEIRGLIQKLTSLRIESIKGQDFSDPNVRKVVIDPDNPRATITLTSGSHTEVLLVGFEMSSEVGALSEFSDPRSNTMSFGVGRDTLVEVLEAGVDDLRWRRLTPSFESSLVTVTSTDAAGDTRWKVERRGQHPQGPWRILAPLDEVGVFEGTGEFSWPQVVVDLDRIEIEEFIAAEEDFVPEITVRVEWRSGAVTRDLELGLRREGERVIARASDRPDERFVLPEKIWELAHLRVERYRERTLLPPWSQLGESLREIEVLNHNGVDLGLQKRAARATFEKVFGNDRQPAVSQVTSAVTFLCGAQAATVHPGDEAPEGTGLQDPRVTVNLTTVDGEVLQVKIGASNGGEEVYASVEPEFAGLVLEVARSRVKDLLELAPQERSLPRPR